MATKEQKTEAFNRIKKTYWDWHVETQGFKPVFDGSDAKGLSKMVNYLFTLDEETDKVVEMFVFITKNWDDLENFYKKNTRLRQINSNIHNIIAHFKNGRHNKTGVSDDYLQRLVADLQDTERND